MKKTLRFIGAFWISLMCLGAFFAFFKQDQFEIHSLQHVLQPGYDAFGRNCVFLLFSAAAQSIKIMLPVGVLCLSLALFLSSFALFKNERIQFVLRASLDTLSSLPGFLIALAIGVLFSHAAFTFWIGSLLLIVPSMTRYFESLILKLREEEYVHASEALGARPFHLWVHHYRPELLRLLAAILPFLIMRLILLETSLSFLGLGATPEHETWGRLLYQGKDYLLEAPWIMLITAAPLCLTLLSFHLLSDQDPH
jgi:peptide/nickel transport system permease protein